MIKIHLSKILGEKRWTQADLSRKTGIRANTISEIYNELVERINIDQLDSICEALDCQISDLLEYIPNKNKHSNNKRL
jgi:putative transcriptional regulator